MSIFLVSGHYCDLTDELYNNIGESFKAFIYLLMVIADEDASGYGRIFDLLTTSSKVVKVYISVL
jgi:hypothetical protein